MKAENDQAKSEWIAERMAIILEGNAFSLGNGRYGSGITERRAREMAEKEYLDLERRFTELD